MTHVVPSPPSSGARPASHWVSCMFTEYKSKISNGEGALYRLNLKLQLEQESLIQVGQDLPS